MRESGDGCVGDGDHQISEERKAKSEEYHSVYGQRQCFQL